MARVIWRVFWIVFQIKVDSSGNKMLHRAREVINRCYFESRCRGIFTTEPIRIKDDNIEIVSLVSHRDLLMALIAIKAFYSIFRKGRITILNDGTLDRQDVDNLRNHLCVNRVVPIREIDCGRTPRGGCWERLIFISECVKHAYVIQIDSDTLAIKALPEVIAAVESKTSFALGTNMGRRIVPMIELCNEMKALGSDHVQVIAEQNFDQLSRARDRKYVRGSAGFAGFAQNSFSRADVEEFSLEMTKIIGETWFNWGSEQVTSNVFVANSPKSTVLPYPKYANFTPGVPWQESVFLHFIGTYRFKRGIYINEANKVISQLKAKSS